MEKMLLKPTEVSEVLSLGRSKVYDLIARGDLPVVRIGKSVRVPADLLREWIAKRISSSENAEAEA